MKIKNIAVTFFIVLMYGCVGNTVMHKRTPENGVGPGAHYHSSSWLKADIKNKINELNSKMNCCSDYSDIDYAKLGFTEKVKTKINKESQIFSIDGNKSYITSIQLPNYSKDITLNITSRKKAPNAAITNTYFYYPALVFLDKNFNPIETQFIPDLKFRVESGLVSDKSALKGTVNLNKDSNIAYIIFYTTDDLLNRKTEYFYTGSYYIEMPESQEKASEYHDSPYIWLVTAAHSVIGELELSLE